MPAEIPRCRRVKVTTSRILDRYRAVTSCARRAPAIAAFLSISPSSAVLQLQPALWPLHHERSRTSESFSCAFKPFLRTRHCLACAAVGAALASRSSQFSWGVLAGASVWGCSPTCSGRLVMCPLSGDECRAFSRILGTLLSGSVDKHAFAAKVQNTRMSSHEVAVVKIPPSEAGFVCQKRY